MSSRDKKFIPPPLPQLSLYPEDLMHSIPDNHLVRVIDQIVDRLNIDFLFEEYKEQGRPPYHPRLLLKAILFAYTRKVYSYRAICREMRENIYFMFLAKGYQPCFKSINNFMTGRLKGQVRTLFIQLIYFLREEEYIDDSVLFVDGTVLAADANKHSYVWKKNTQRYKEGLYRRITALLDLAEKINEEEDRTLGDLDLPERGEKVTKEALDDRIEQLAVQINRQTSKKKKRTMEAVQGQLKNASVKLKEYEEQEATFGQRNSYSKTDPDATFIRDKSDNLIPAYNLQVSSQNGFVCHYSLSQSPSDQRAFHDHLHTLEEGLQPNDYVGDAGYGTTSNYMELEKRQINPYLKDHYFHKDQSKQCRDNPFRKENFPYDKESDTYTCPNNEKLTFKELQEEPLHNGECVTYRIYHCLACANCPLKENCTKSKRRTISVSTQVDKYKAEARANLLSPKGIAYRKRRGPDVESVFGHLKHNAASRRLSHRGLGKVEMEIGMKLLSYNLLKVAKSIENGLFYLYLNLSTFMVPHRKHAILFNQCTIFRAKT